MVDIINNSLFSWQINPLTALVRQFLTLGGVNEFGNAGVYTAVDGDTIEFDFASTVTTNQTVFDELAGANRLFATLGTTGTAFTVPAGVTVDIDGGGNTVVPDGKLHHVTLTIGAAAVGLKIDIYGKKNDATEFFDGVLANIRFTGSDNRFYAMKGGRFGLGAYETDALATLGANLFDDLLTAGGGGTIDTVDGVTTVTNGAGGFDYAHNTNAFATVAGQTYIAELQALGGTSIDAVTFGAGTAVGGIELGGAGQFGVGPRSFVFTASDTTTFVRAGPNDPDTGVTFIFSGLTVREAPNAMALFNIVAGDQEQMTQVGADWLGAERWLLGAVASDGTEGVFFQLTGNEAIVTVGEIYRWTGTTTGMTAGELQIRNGGVPISATSNGVQVVDLEADGVNVRVRTGASQPNNGATILPSVKRLLEAP